METQTLHTTIANTLDARSFGFILTDHVSRDYFDSEYVSEDDFLGEVLSQLARWGNSEALADNARDDASAALAAGNVEDTLNWWMDAAEALDLIRDMELNGEQYTRFFTDNLFNGHADDALAYARTLNSDN